VPSSKYYKVWVWVPGTSTAWVEVPHFTDLVATDQWSGVPGLRFTAYSRDDNVRGKFLPKAIVRFTKRFHVDGSPVTNPDATSPNNPLVRDYYLLNPQGDDKSVVAGNATVWTLDCAGPAEPLLMATVTTTRTSTTTGGVTFDAAGAATGTLANLVNYYLNDSVDGLNNRGSGNQAVLGVVDTSPTVKVKAKNEKLWDHLLDLSDIGDATTKFPWQLWVDFQVNGSGASRTFAPRIHLLKPNNTTFAFPLGHVGYSTVDPFAGPTENKILDERTELVDLNVLDEKQRIVNRCVVRFAGAGTGNAGGESAPVTSAPSITAFKLREVKSLDPWIQDSATAALRANTVINTLGGVYLGSATGIKRASAAYKRGELYEPNFDAVLGDTVGIRRRDGSQAVQGRLLGWTYQQQDEGLTFEVGIPGLSLQGTVGELQRRLLQRVANLSVVLSSTQPTQLIGTASSLGVLNLPVPHYGSNAVNLGFVTGPATITRSAHGYYLRVVFGTFGATSPGPYRVEVQLRDSGTGSLSGVVFEDTYFLEVFGNDAASRQFYPFTSGMSNDPNGCRVTVSNLSSTDGVVSVTVEATPFVLAGHSHNV
jgi:hypothetical protein